MSLPAIQEADGGNSRIGTGYYDFPYGTAQYATGKLGGRAPDPGATFTRKSSAYEWR